MKEREPQREKQELPDSYGTGRDPAQEQRHGLTMTLLWILVGINLTFNLFILKNLNGGGMELIQDSESVRWSYHPETEAFQTDQERLLQSVESGLVRIVTDSEKHCDHTGVVLSEDGYILTNASLVDGMQELTVILPDGSDHRAWIVGIDGESDLAVLKTEATNLCPAQIAESDGMNTDGNLILFSFTLGQDCLEQALPEDSKKAIGGVDRRVFQVDCSRGSLLINKEGELVAFGKGDGEALTMSDIVALAGELIFYGRVGAPNSFGIEVAQMDQAQCSYWNLPGGVVVNRVFEDGNAWKAGLQTGDILLRIGSSEVTDTPSYWNAVGNCREGETAIVEVYRSGQRIELEIELNQEKG